MTHHLVLLRHGATAVVGGPRFTGWLDLPLSDAGRVAANRAGALLREHDLTPSAAFSSALARAIDTAHEVLLASSAHGVRLQSAAELNERHYGAWQGRHKSEIRDALGAERYREIRRAVREQPDDGESLDDVSARVVPFWIDVLRPQLEANPVLLVVAHSNSLRALIRHLDGLSDADVAEVNVPLAMPLVYRWSSGALSAGSYLEPERAHAAAAAVAQEGATAPDLPLHQ